MDHGSRTTQGFGKGHAGKKPSFLGPMLFLSLLTLLLAFSVGLLLRESLKQKEAVETTIMEKEDLSQQKEELIVKLDELEQSCLELAEANLGYEQELAEKKEEINRLRERVRQAPSPEVLAGYMEQVREMDLQLEDYGERIAKLQEENRLLAGENVQMRTALDQVTAISSELQSENLEMAEQIRSASILNLTDVQVTPMRETRRGERETRRARRTSMLQICFTIQRNTLAQAGDHAFYFQVIAPDDRVLISPGQESFMLREQQLPLSLKENIDYQNIEKTACVVFNYPSGFEKGMHQFRIYSGENELWHGFFELN